MLIFSKQAGAIKTRHNVKSHNDPQSEGLLVNPSQSQALDGKVRSVVFFAVEGAVF